MRNKNARSAAMRRRFRIVELLRKRRTESKRIDDLKLECPLSRRQLIDLGASRWPAGHAGSAALCVVVGAIAVTQSTRQ